MKIEDQENIRFKSRCIDCKEKEAITLFNSEWAVCGDCLKKAHPHFFINEAK